ncbi:MAG: hypothetical protein COA81_00475 [Alphaproteobacteria bacterium]|nr:MAG: hypothetical protein COA81_00475 [Alphaproteobacteria bacterium]
MTYPALRKSFCFMIILWGGLSLTTLPAVATVADGVYAYEQGDYQKARMEWLPYAALGNPNALYNLGQLSRMGRGVEKDYTIAQEYYLRAAEKGHVGAQRNLGTLYYFGRLGQVDYAKAHNWLLKAARNGDPRSQLMTGTMYYNGQGVGKDPLKAYAWISLSAQRGLGNAKTSLNKLRGVMTSEDIEKAKKLIPAMISRQLSPDDVGLMVKQPESAAPEMAEITPPAPPKAATTAPEQPADRATEDNYRIQLGSFRAEKVAQKTLDDLQQKFADIIGDHKGTVEFADLGEKGIYYRLQLSPFKDRASANELCAQLTQAGQGCYVLKR